MVSVTVIGYMTGLSSHGHATADLSYRGQLSEGTEDPRRRGRGGSSLERRVRGGCGVEVAVR